MILAKSDGKYSPELFTAMESREPNLLKNAAFLAAIYLDPRFQCLIDEPQKDLAKLHLTALWKRIMALESSHKSWDGFSNQDQAELEDKNEGDNQKESEGTSDITDQILSAASSSRKRESEKMDNDALRLTEVKQTLAHFNNVPRFERTGDIFKWWQKHPHQDVRLLAEVALSLPVTQVSVERTFSGLRYILDDLRLGMKDDVIDAIMFLRCNA